MYAYKFEVRKQNGSTFFIVVNAKTDKGALNKAIGNFNASRMLRFSDGNKYHLNPEFIYKEELN